MSQPGETRDDVLQDAFLAKLMEPFRAFEPARILRKTVYTFHARIAEHFRDVRILLVGDAAHLTPPLAGQGTNAGLRDAQKVAACVQGKAEPHILDSYETERCDPAWNMIQIAVAMGSIVMPADREQIAFRNLRMPALEPFPQVPDYLINMRLKPKPRYHDGLFLGRGDQPFEASLVGEMIPQPRVRGAGGTILLDEALGAGFALIAQSRDASDVVAAMDRDRLLGLPLSKAHLQSHRHNDLADFTVVDTAIARPLLTHRDQILLVRPDRYCAAAFPPQQAEAAMRAFTKPFGVDCPAAAEGEETS